tara:strand:+ start:1134 stop:1241 length:108 start_codon:yes stop_codon:yes gene_type:complete
MYKTDAWCITAPGRIKAKVPARTRQGQELKETDGK